MKRTILLLLLSCSSMVLAAQSSYTVLYNQNNYVDEYGRSPAPELKGALYILSDTMTVYRLAWKEKELMKKVDLVSRDLHHGIIHPMNGDFYFEIVHLQNEDCYIKCPKDTAKWVIDTLKTIIILDKKCVAATLGDNVVWFAPSIPVNAGPGNVFGLPGLVLGVYNIRYSIVYLAYKIIPAVPEIVSKKQPPIISLEAYRERNRTRQSNINNDLLLRKLND